MYDINKYKCYGYDEKNEDRSIRAQCVVAISTYAGKTVKGYAKCHPDDTWDWEKGKALAIARCAEKIAAKRNARATRKAAEAQDILAEAIAYLNDMLDYQINSADELAIANAEVNKLISKM